MADNKPQAGCKRFNVGRPDHRAKSGFPAICGPWFRSGRLAWRGQTCSLPKLFAPVQRLRGLPIPPESHSMALLPACVSISARTSPHRPKTWPHFSQETGESSEFSSVILMTEPPHSRHLSARSRPSTCDHPVLITAKWGTVHLDKTPAKYS